MTPHATQKSGPRGDRIAAKRLFRICLIAAGFASAILYGIAAGTALAELLLLGGGQ